MEKSIDLVMTVLALFKLGAVYVPIDKLYPVTRVEFMISEASIYYKVIRVICSFTSSRYKIRCTGPNMHRRSLEVFHQFSFTSSYLLPCKSS
jgi:hypothetical protein